MNLKPLVRQGWSIEHAIAAIALVAFGAFATREAWADIYRIAMTDEEQSHIFLVPIVAAWMVMARKIRMSDCPPAGQMIGPIILLGGFAVHWFGYANAMQSLWHGGAVVIFIGALLTALGKNVLFRFLPAFVVLVLLVPIPGLIRQQISIPLQTASAATTQAILEIFGTPIERNGNLLTINGTDVAVAEACNGMRMVFALFLVSYAFAFSMPLRNATRFTILIASPFAAIMCNVIRLIPTVLLYGYSTDKIAGQFHDISGWLMLPIAFGLLLGIIRLLRWALIPVNRFTLAYQ